MTTRPSTRALSIANAFGALGYISLIMQWLWMALILGYPLITSRSFDWLPKPPAVQPEPLDFGEAFPIVLLAVVFITVTILALTIITVIRLPKTVGKQSARVSHRTARVISPVVARHRPLPKKKQAKLSYKIILTIKCIAILIPLITLFFAAPIAPLTPAIIQTIAVFCAMWTIAYFAIQQIIALLAKVKLDSIW